MYHLLRFSGIGDAESTTSFIRRSLKVMISASVGVAIASTRQLYKRNVEAAIDKVYRIFREVTEVIKRERERRNLAKKTEGTFRAIEIDSYNVVLQMFNGWFLDNLFMRAPYYLLLLRLFPQIAVSLLCNSSVLFHLRFSLVIREDMELTCFIT